MATHKKFCWVIKDFSSLQSEGCILSDPVLIGDCKWQLRARLLPKKLRARPKGEKVDDHFHFALFLDVADSESLPGDWRRYVQFRLTIVSQGEEKKEISFEGLCWFDFWNDSWGSESMIPLTKLRDKDEAFLVNDEVIIVAEVDVLEVIVTSVEESIVVNGFQVLPSQVETVRCIFEKHPDIAVDFRAKSQHRRTTCMNVLLNLIETLCKSLQELSTDDLVDADIALTYLKDVSFKIDWLEKKLDQVKEKKEKEQSALAKLQELDALVEEQKAELLASRTTLSFDDIVCDDLDF